jgi:peptidylglycine monooxygenase
MGARIATQLRRPDVPADSRNDLSEFERNVRVVIAGRGYEVIRDWAPAPEGIARGRISTLAVDSGGRLHVLRRGVDPPVLVYSPAGDFVGAFGDGAVFDAHGIAIDAQDRVFVVDRDAHQVLCFSTGGALLFRLGERHRPRWGAPFNHPTDVAVAPDGEIYVSDGYGNGRVHVFAADGALRLSFGAVGHGAGEFMTPHALLVDRENRIVVVDRENNRVQRFDRDGRFLDALGGLCRPMDAFERDDGVLLVTDVVPSVGAFSSDGARVGRGRPSLNGAHGIAGDRAGAIYLAEIDPNSIACLRPLPGATA